MNSNERGMTMINEEDDEQIELPPGFRFHPTDEELITYYLSPKVANVNFNSVAVGEVDLNKVEPWELPRKAKMGEKEWYFFCVRDKKYPTGSRTNRATGAGYWKATGKDKEIFSRPKALVGMKKTLVFYTGRAPKGFKTNWVMHEYRLEGKYAKHNLPKSSKNDWVISRVFDKGSNMKKMQIQGDSNVNQLLYQQTSSFLPPLMNYSPNRKANHSEENWSMSVLNPSHVTCFSSQITTTTVEEKDEEEEQKDNNFKPVDHRHHLNGFINNNNYYTSSSGSSVSPSFQFHSQNQHLVGSLAYSGDPPVFLQEQSKPSMEMEGGTVVVGYGGNTCTWTNDQSHDTLTTTDHILLSSGVLQRPPFQGYHYDGPVDLDSLVNY